MHAYLVMHSELQIKYILKYLLGSKNQKYIFLNWDILREFREKMPDHEKQE